MTKMNKKVHLANCQDAPPLCRNPLKSYGPNQEEQKSASRRDAVGFFAPALVIDIL
jgi:hypothetical protein